MLDYQVEKTMEKLNNIHSGEILKEIRPVSA